MAEFRPILSEKLDRAGGCRSDWVRSSRKSRSASWGRDCSVLWRAVEWNVDRKEVGEIVLRTCD